jgi:GH15 family glucan-1,4-alpha-glucosidase
MTYIYQSINFQMLYEMLDAAVLTLFLANFRHIHAARMLISVQNLYSAPRQPPI